MQNLFEIRTLVFVITLMLVARALVLALVWRKNPNYAPLSYWAWGSMLIAAGTLLVGLRPYLPPFMAVILANSLIVFGWGIYSVGVIAALRLPIPWKAIIVLSLSGVIGAWVFFQVEPNFGWRSLCVVLPTILFDVYVAVHCWQAPPGRQANTLRWLGVVLFIQVVANLVKLVHAVDSHNPDVFDTHFAVLQFYIVLVASLTVGTALLILLAMQQVQIDLDSELAIRRKNEQSLALAAMVYQSSSEGMIVMDAKGIISAVNPAFSRISGYGEADIIGKKLSIFRSPRQPKELYDQVTESLRQQGAWQGDIWSQTREGRDFAVRLTINSIYDAEGNPSHRVALFQDVTQQMVSAETIYHQANFDRLTGLANRYRFFDELPRHLSLARRNQERVAVLYIDLNRFKPVNDLHGHEAGDAVLKTVAERWQKSLRSEDVLARLGGDEFAVIVPKVQGPDEAIRIGEKLIKVLTEPVHVHADVDCQIGCSVGVALYPLHAHEMDELLAIADAAMYSAKAQGANQPFLAPVPQTMPATSDWMSLRKEHLTGVQEIDVEHQHIVALVNQIIRTLRKADDTPLRPLLDQLIADTREHFQTEERLMSTYGYEDAGEHAHQHALLVEEVQTLIARYANGDELRLLQALKVWLLNHIVQRDKALGDYLVNKGLH